MESCSTENLELRKKVEVLENTNRTLLQQLQKLQTLVMGKVSRTCKLAGTQTGTCLMVVVLCFAVAFGSFFQGYGPYPSATKMALPSQHSLQEPYTASVVRSRNLLIYEEHSPPEEPSSPVSAGELGAGTEVPPCSGFQRWSPGRMWLFPISLSRMRPAWRSQCSWSCSSTWSAPNWREMKH